MKYLWITVFAAVLIWSGILPKDRFTWFLEVMPAIVGAILLAVSYRSFRFTPLLYALILMHCIILMVGGHYTYAEVPTTSRQFSVSPATTTIRSATSPRALCRP